jgi:hypothetical protein
MEVSQALESDNFAVMGGGRARAFQIGQSAHAFKILSDALYSDKFKAVVREILCNSVDAHIASGNAGVPVDVTLTDSELVFRDYGTGIADDKMVEIYATYFGSTKTGDESQTGGFGLGSKSPFAYTDHFTVISRHKGMQRVYALYIADDETDGAPAVKLMAPPVPTKESGVTVTVPLVDSSDRRKFADHIQVIVRDGGMNVRLNGTVLPANDYTELRKNVVGEFIQRDYSRREGISLLYGNVLYPLGNNAEIDKLRGELNNFTVNNADLILYAPPSSLTVTPSRESISYSPRTIKTVNALLRKALGQIRTSLERTIAEEIKRLAEACPRNELSGIWLKREIAVADEGFMASIKGVSSGADIGRKAALGWIYDGRGRHRNFWQRGSEERVVPHQRDLARRLIRRAAKFHKSHRANVWDIDADDSYATMNSQIRFLGAKVSRIAQAIDYKGPFYARITKATLSSLKKPGRGERRIGNYHSLNTIVVSPSRDRALNNPTLGIHLIIPKLDQPTADKLVALCRLHGFDFDGYSSVKHDNPATLRPKKPKAEKVVAAPDTYPALTGAENKHRYRVGRVHLMPTATITKPTAYVAVNIMRASQHYGHETFGQDADLGGIINWLKKYMPNVVIARNETTWKKLVKAGVPSLRKVLMDELETFAKTNPAGLDLIVKTRASEGYGYYGVDRICRELVSIGARGAAIVNGTPKADVPDDRIFSLTNVIGSLFNRGMGAPSWLKETLDECGARLTKALGPFVKKVAKTNPPSYLKFYSDICEDLDLSGLNKKSLERLLLMMEADMKAYQEKQAARKANNTKEGEPDDE